MSIAYPFNIPQNEANLVFGDIPREVHFHVKRHPVSSLPATDDGVTDWCNQRWAEKEVRLRRFYSDKKFLSADGASGDHHKQNGTQNSAAAAAADSANVDDDVGDDGGESSARLRLKIAFVYWTSFVVGITILLCCSWVARWYVGFQIVFFLAMGFRGGFELFQADYYNKFFNERKREE